MSVLAWFLSILIKFFLYRHWARAGVILPGHTKCFTNKKSLNTTCFHNKYAVGRGLWAVGLGQWAVGGEPWAVGRGMWAVGCGLWAVGRGPWAVGCGPCGSEPENRNYYVVTG
jgi:hypothetical protein